MVLTAAFRQIDGLQAYTPQVGAFEAEVVGLKRGHGRELLAGSVVGEVEVAVEHAAEPRQVGQHVRELSEVEVAEADGEVVDERRVGDCLSETAARGVHEGEAVGSFVVGVSVSGLGFAVYLHGGAVVGH